GHDSEARRASGRAATAAAPGAFRGLHGRALGVRPPLPESPRQRPLARKTPVVSLYLDSAYVAKCTWRSRCSPGSGPRGARNRIVFFCLVSGGNGLHLSPQCPRKAFEQRAGSVAAGPVSHPRRGRTLEVAAANRGA